VNEIRLQPRTILLAASIAILSAACSSNPTQNAEATTTPQTVVSTPSPAFTATVPATETQEATATPSPEPTVATVEPTLPSEIISDQDGMVQIYIPAGEFIMGSDDEDAKKTVAGGVASPEIPVNRVYLEGYWIDKYEITNAQYRLCVEQGPCIAPLLPDTFMGFPYYDNPEYADYPVIYVDYYMARDYCAWAGRRLPSEAEWAKAARGTDGRRYTWGDDPVTSERANFCDVNCPKTHADPNYDDGYAETAPVGSFPAGASPYGVMDMAGNVWEWTSTIPQPYPYDRLDGREEPDLRARDEVVFGDGPQRVWRGGTWANGTWWLRASIRYHAVPGYWHNSLGFRCAASE
jgi:formylglycine-generating enzyme required for sulfatase activity